MMRPWAVCCLKWIIRIRGIRNMYRETMNAAKGIGLGVLTGVAVAALSTHAMKNGKRGAKELRKNAGKVIHSVGSFLGDVERML